MFITQESCGALNDLKTHFYAFIAGVAFEDLRNIALLPLYKDERQKKKKRN